MKGLIVKKEWLDLIFDGGKVWEMRSTRTSIRGKIALIESGSGTIVGEAELVECKPPICGRLDAIATIEKHRVADYGLLEKWKYPWVLRGAKRLDIPVPYRHPKGAVVWVNLDR